MHDGEIAALASAGCSRCWGGGWHRQSVCVCVYRSVGWIVIREYQRLKLIPAADRPERETDFVLDVELISRRIAGRLCRLWMAHFERGESLSRLQWMPLTNLLPRLGQAYATTAPYALYPIDEYFGLNYKSPAVCGRLAMAA